MTNKNCDDCENCRMFKDCFGDDKGANDNEFCTILCHPDNGCLYISDKIGWNSPRDAIRVNSGEWDLLPEEAKAHMKDLPEYPGEYGEYLNGRLL